MDASQRENNTSRLTSDLDQRLITLVRRSGLALQPFGALILGGASQERHLAQFRKAPFGDDAVIEKFVDPKAVEPLAPRD
jgi:hypothetical protein